MKQVYADIKWFTVESKKYMGYGQTISKVKFWCRYPIACTKYMYYTLKDRWRNA